MNVGANYMREHVKEDARIHYVITNGGGQPNVVPPPAEVWYYLRANKHADVELYFEWLKQIAQGAALMTRTTLEEIQVDTDMHEMLPNRALSELIQKNLEWVGAPKFSEDEKAFARKTQEPLGRKIEQALSETVEPLPRRAHPGRGLDRRRRHQLVRAGRAVDGGVVHLRSARSTAGRSWPAPARRSARRACWSRPRRSPDRRSSSSAIRR